jgi:hypothetical protein
MGFPEQDTKSFQDWIPRLNETVNPPLSSRKHAVGFPAIGIQGSFDSFEHARFVVLPKPLTPMDRNLNSAQFSVPLPELAKPYDA